MNTHTTKEIAVAILMIIVAGICMFYAMTPMMYLTVHIIAIGFFVLFAITIWRTMPIDEREAAHRAISSDIAFTIGGVLLGIGMMYQIYTEGHIDVWLIAVLASMVIARAVSQVWLDKHN